MKFEQNMSLQRIDNSQHQSHQQMRKHKLWSNFSLWYLKKNDGMGDYSDYSSNIKKLSTFGTVEDFWAYYSHLTRPNDLNVAVDYHCFRDGIQPLWEDPENEHGGKWVIRLRKGMASRCWENALLALVGGEFRMGSEMCGIVVSMKYQQDSIAFWNKTANDEKKRNIIRDKIIEILKINRPGALEYRPHKAALTQYKEGLPMTPPRSSRNNNGSSSQYASYRVSSYPRSPSRSQTSPRRTHRSYSAKSPPTLAPQQPRSFVMQQQLGISHDNFS